MKKGGFFIFTLLIGLVALFTVSSTTAFAYGKSHLTVVRGNVYDTSNGGKGIGGLSVAVTCTTNMKRSVTKTATTDNNGLYTVRFGEERCEEYKPVFATVTDNGQTQTDNVSVSAQNTATMDFYFGTVSVAVPEFNVIEGAVAAVASFGSFFLLKKRALV